jgi:type III pantothenate kinase
MISRLKAELDGDVTVIGTGGLAVVLAEDCPALDRVEPELTLLGLRWVAEQAM